MAPLKSNLNDNKTELFSSFLNDPLKYVSNLPKNISRLNNMSVLYLNINSYILLLYPRLMNGKQGLF
jgi:hypothetical protein